MPLVLQTLQIHRQLRSRWRFPLQSRHIATLDDYIDSLARLDPGSYDSRRQSTSCSKVSQLASGPFAVLIDMSKTGSTAFTDTASAEPSPYGIQVFNGVITDMRYE